jgi:hypothetical protein
VDKQHVLRSGAKRYPGLADCNAVPHIPGVSYHAVYERTNSHGVPAMPQVQDQRVREAVEKSGMTWAQLMNDKARTSFAMALVKLTDSLSSVDQIILKVSRSMHYANLGSHEDNSLEFKRIETEVEAGRHEVLSGSFIVFYCHPEDVGKDVRRPDLDSAPPMACFSIREKTTGDDTVTIHDGIPVCVSAIPSIL